ncbi:hypothetical protein BXZ70DRAFT_452333 [Cristinia sonorae]|uniref:G domain-containing protein n=1 Tax=Cristinia sonorae TaxID=1940300 RepID=A0A8K0UI27_9AGAR|nr:hypothetical protein BXZ70DRAFT_452333 [Cristinia sonorae]
MSTQAISSCGDEVLIAVVGRPGSGKTSCVPQFIRQATSSKRRLSSYFAILSPTQRVEAAHPIRLLGKVVTLIDTPGYDRNRPSRGQTGRGLAETELVSKILSFLSATFGEGRKLDGIIFVHHAWHTRHTKSSDMDVWKPVLAQSATVDNIIVVGTATIRGTLSNVGHVHGGEAARKASVSTRSNTSESASSSGVDVPAENCFSNNMIIFNINSRKSAQDAVCRVMDAYIVAPESGADTIGSRESWHTCLTDVSPDPQDRSIVDGSESPQTPEDKGQ